MKRRTSCRMLCAKRGSSPKAPSFKVSANFLICKSLNIRSTPLPAISEPFLSPFGNAVASCRVVS